MARRTPGLSPEDGGEVETAPQYDPNVPLERPIESRLYEHYHRPAYWDEERKRH